MDNTTHECEICFSTSLHLKIFVTHWICPFCMKMLLLQNLKTIYGNDKGSTITIDCLICSQKHETVIKDIITLSQDDIIPQKCSIHDNENISDNYCLDCDKFICIQCFDAEHRQHLIKFEGDFYCYGHVIDEIEDNKCSRYCNECQIPLCEDCGDLHTGHQIIPSNQFKEEQAKCLENYLSEFNESFENAKIDNNNKNSISIDLRPIGQFLTELPEKIKKHSVVLAKNLKGSSEVIKKCAEQVGKYLKTRSKHLPDLSMLKLSDNNLNEISKELKNIENSIEKIKLCCEKMYPSDQGNILSYLF
jgi:hypothetical protein